MSDIKFTTEEMREFLEEADENYRRRPFKETKRGPKTKDVAALKIMVHHTQNPEAMAIIAGIDREQLQGMLQQRDES